jgi:hypothetical protein
VAAGWAGDLLRLWPPAQRAGTGTAALTTRFGS